MTAQIKFNEEINSFYIDGDFNFSIGHGYLTEDRKQMLRKIEFDLDLNFPQIINPLQTEMEVFDMFGEKLKNDFINFIIKWSEEKYK